MKTGGMSSETGVGDFSDSFNRLLWEGFILIFHAFFKMLPFSTAVVFLCVKSTSLALLELGLGFPGCG